MYFAADAGRAFPGQAVVVHEVQAMDRTGLLPRTERRVVNDDSGVPIVGSKASMESLAEILNSDNG